MRVGPSLIPGAVVCGNRGLGVRGSTILADTATGDHGAGYLYNDVDPGDESKAFRGLITRLPTNGTLWANEDGSFKYVGASDSFDVRLYVDGIDLGTETVTITIGASPGTATGTISPLSVIAPTATATGAASASGTSAALSLVAPTATASASSSIAYWPTPDQVVAGITYGPTGADYTGTATAGAGTTIVDGISFTVTDQISMVINATPTIMEINV